MMKSQGRAGFTLIELAVVLVIIGILISAVMVGRTVIRAAQLRNTVGEVTKYSLAIKNFSDKYSALPGDFSNAETFWGSDIGCPNTAYSATPKNATCNGNGDGYIQGYEAFRAWQQLSASGFLMDSNTSSVFNGISGTGSAFNAVVGVNVPAAGLPGGGFTLQFVSVASGGDANYFSYIYNHVFTLGSVAGNSYTYGALLAPDEALGIDIKMDDGLPASGSIQPFKSTLNPNCTTSDSPSASLYKTSGTDRTCALNFITGF